nr:JAB domain-containing protein [Paraliobacillus zengyii]
MVDPREIIKSAIFSNGVSFMVGQNHSSGDTRS